MLSKVFKRQTQLVKTSVRAFGGHSGHGHGHECGGIPPSRKNQDYIDLDLKYCAHNYKPLPITLSRGDGIYVWDVSGRQYYDFLCGYSSSNQGHCHPKILKAFIEQATKITQPSRAFHND